jgi:hypothetical protein
MRRFPAVMNLASKTPIEDIMENKGRSREPGTADHLWRNR